MLESEWATGDGMSTLLQLFLMLTVLPVAVSLLGGALAVWRAPGQRTRSVTGHFAAEVVLGEEAGNVVPR
jgi:hypothetical protein